MSYIFQALCQKNLTIDFIFAKNVLLRCAFLFKKKTNVLRKKPQLIKWFNLLLLKPTPPQKLLYKPRLFYSKISSHSKITPPTGATTTTTRSPPAWGLATIKRRRRTQKSTRALVFVRSTSWSGLSWTILNKGCGA